MRIQDAARMVARYLAPARSLRRVRGALAAPSTLTLALRARFSRRSVTGSAPVVVSLTSYGERIERVHLTLEAIAGGSVRPSRVILWLDDARALAAPPSTLARMARRGVEIAATPDLGPHKKYYPYVCSSPHHTLPLVTADDDVLYGYRWLARLLDRHRHHPQDVIAHRAHRITMADGHIAPYALWEDLDVDEVGPRTFATGASGVLYPPRMLDALRDAGEGFLECAPRADDVWLHATALRAGITVRPVEDGLTSYRSVPGTTTGGLRTENVLRGGNDTQIRATYTPADVAVLWRDAVERGTGILRPSHQPNRQQPRHTPRQQPHQSSEQPGASRG